MSMDYVYGAHDSYLESGVDDRNLKEEDHNEFPLHYPSRNQQIHTNLLRLHSFEHN